MTDPEIGMIRSGTNPHAFELSTILIKSVLIALQKSVATLMKF